MRRAHVSPKGKPSHRTPVRRSCHSLSTDGRQHPFILRRGCPVDTKAPGQCGPPPDPRRPALGWLLAGSPGAWPFILSHVTHHGGACKSYSLLMLVLPAVHSQDLGVHLTCLYALFAH